MFFFRIAKNIVKIEEPDKNLENNKINVVKHENSIKLHNEPKIEESKTEIIKIEIKLKNIETKEQNQFYYVNTENNQNNQTEDLPTQNIYVKTEEAFIQKNLETENSEVKKDEAEHFFKIPYILKEKNTEEKNNTVNENSKKNNYLFRKK